ncbi:unnamed protein product [Amoebophrya sp. A120]|nr:unnamed protein product [Amoebophrya sp. A120]|eukprot:GSA120T00003660001.1
MKRSRDEAFAFAPKTRPVLESLAPKRPLPLSKVVARADELLRSYLGHPTDFIIAGSYPAAVEIDRETRTEKQTPYNDIDVYYAGSFFEDWQKGDPLKPRVLDCASHAVTIDGEEVELSLIRYAHCDLEQLVEAFDINCIRVGYKIQQDYQHIDATVYKIRPVVRETYRAADFESWLKAMRCAVTDPNAAGTELRMVPLEDMLYTNPCASFIRVIKKAGQLCLPYVLPDLKALAAKLHMRIIGKENFEKFKKLPAKEQRWIRNLFHIKKLPTWVPNRKSRHPREFSMIDRLFSMRLVTEMNAKQFGAWLTKERVEIWRLESVDADVQADWTEKEIAKLDTAAEGYGTKKAMLEDPAGRAAKNYEHAYSEALRICRTNSFATVREKWLSEYALYASKEFRNQVEPLLSAEQQVRLRAILEERVTRTDAGAHSSPLAELVDETQVGIHTYLLYIL